MVECPKTRPLWMVGIVVLSVCGFVSAVPATASAAGNGSALAGSGTVSTTTDWVEYPTNPILDPGRAYYPSVVQNDSGTYRMWFTGPSVTLHTATSTNGTNWSTPQPASGLTGNAHHAVVERIGDHYRIWYWDLGGDRYSISSIRTATSQDGVTWTNDQPITQDGSSVVDSSGWNRGTIGAGEVLYNPNGSDSIVEPTSPATIWRNKYIMYYSGTTGGSHAIGIAVSADGVHWQGYDGNPVYTGANESWISGSSGDYVYPGTVTKDKNGTYHMWYSGGDGDLYGIGYASSSNGVDWTPASENPIFTKSSGVGWRNKESYTPAVVDDKMWFSGENGNQAIGMAVDRSVVNVDQGTEYDSIQRAINEANPGDTIRVRPGTYNESVIVNTSDLRIVGATGNGPGAAPDAPVLNNGAGESINGFNAAIVVANGTDNVTIEGFTIRNYDFGIYIDAGGVITGPGESIHDVVVRSNTISTGNGIQGATVGDANELRDVRVRNNLLKGSRVTMTAVNEGTAQNVVIADNTVRSRTAADGIGLQTYNRSYPSLGLTDPGPGHERLANVTITRNDVEKDPDDNGRNGDAMQFTFRESGLGTDVTVANNSLSGAQTGLLLEGNGTYDDVDVVGNRFTDSNNAIKTRPADSEEGATDVSNVTVAYNYLGASVVHPDGAEGVLNASYNYWNASDGPSGAYKGSGVSVTENVTVEPYYTNANFTALSVENRDTGVHYPTIQAAIDDASAGDTIFVRNGTYTTEVDIGKPITIVGEDPEGVVIEEPSDAKQSDQFNNNLVFVSPSVADPSIRQSDWYRSERNRSATMSGVVLRNFTVAGDRDGDGNKGVYTNYVDGVRYENLRVHGHDAQGFGNGWSWNVTLAGVDVHHTGNDGATFFRTNDSTVTGSVAHHTADDGFDMHGNGNAVRDSLVYNVSALGVEIEEVGTTATVDNVTVRNVGTYRPAGSGESLVAGVRFGTTTASATVTVINSTIVGTTYDGPGSATVSGIALAGANATLHVRGNEFADQRVHVAAVGPGTSSGWIDAPAVLSDNDFDAATYVLDANGESGNAVFGAIQPAVDAASSGQTIVAGGGTYDENVDVSKDVVVRGDGTVRGVVTLSGSGAEFRGLAVHPPEFTPGDRPTAAILVTASDTVVANTTTTVTGDAAPGERSVTVHGIQVFDGGNPPVSNVTVRSNHIEQVINRGTNSWPGYGGAVGIKVQGTVDGITVTDNAVTDVWSAGWAYGVVVTPSGNAPAVSPKNVSVTSNRIGNVTADKLSGIAVGVDTESGSVGGQNPANASEVTVRRNGLLASDVGVVNKDTTHALNATNNWWGDNRGPGFAGTNVSNAGPVIVDPYLDNTAYRNVRLSDETVSPGEAVTVTATISNTGAYPGTFAASLLVNGSSLERETLRLTGGETTAVSFTHTFDQTGEYAVRVGDASTATVDVTSGSDGDDGGDGGGGGGGQGAETTPTPEPTPVTTTATGPTPTPTPTATQTTSGATETTTTTTPETETDVPTTGAGGAPAPTTEATPTDQSTPGSTGPGLGLVVTLVALLSAAVLVRRRSDTD